MNQAVAIDNLAEAERAVLEGQARIAQQREIVAALENGPHDRETLAAARAVLASMLEMQVENVAYRNRLVRAIGG